MIKVTPEEIKALVERMARLPEAKPLVAGIKRFTPDDLTKAINDRLPRTPRAPRRPSAKARVKAVVEAARALGIDPQTVEVDGVRVTRMTPPPHDEFEAYWAKKDAGKKA